MKLQLVLAAVATGALAAKQSVLTLTSDERAVLGAELAEWREKFGAVAAAQGVFPLAAIESVSQEDALNDQLQRLLNTKFAIVEARAANPDARFDHHHPFALLSEAEFAQYVKGSFAEGQRHLRSLEEVTLDDVVQADGVDWTTSSNCVNPVRNQGSCGSCWAFATVGVVESAHCIATGKLFDLSEQQVTSCSTNGGSQGCNGGWPWYAIDWMVNGVCLEQDWPYVAQTGSCNKQCNKQPLAIGSSVRVSGESGLASALNVQPVSVTVSAGNSVWQNYRGGVVSACPGAQSDHAVIAVGYDASSYRIKNSWAASWGEAGYIRLARGTGGQGTCNVVGGVSFPKIQGTPNPTSASPTPTTAKPAPTSSKPTPSTSTPSDKCGNNHNVCVWPLTGQVVPYNKAQCAQFSSFVWCP